MKNNVKIFPYQEYPADLTPWDSFLLSHTKRKLQYLFSNLNEEAISVCTDITEIMSKKKKKQSLCGSRNDFTQWEKKENYVTEDTLKMHLSPEALNKISNESAYYIRNIYYTISFANIMSYIYQDLGKNLFQYKYMLNHPKCVVTLLWRSGLCDPVIQRAMLAVVLLLAGAPMPDRLRGRVQTKTNIWSSRLGVDTRKGIQPQKKKKKNPAPSHFITLSFTILNNAKK